MFSIGGRKPGVCFVWVSVCAYVVRVGLSAVCVCVCVSVFACGACVWLCAREGGAPPPLLLSFSLSISHTRKTGRHVMRGTSPQFL